MPLRSFAPSHPASQPAVPREKLHLKLQAGFLAKKVSFTVPQRQPDAENCARRN